jgi:hypothetical protein
MYSPEARYRQENYPYRASLQQQGCLNSIVHRCWNEAQWSGSVEIARFWAYLQKECAAIAFVREPRIPNALWTRLAEWPSGWHRVEFV